MLFVLPVVHADELPRKRYELKLPKTGTRLPPAVIKSSLPLNRRYADLDDAEKAELRAAYDRMPPEDEPPFPSDGLMPVFDALKQGADRLGVLGELVLLVDVDSAGKAQHVDAYGKVDAAYAQFAARVLAATHFKPGICGGRPCNMQYRLAMEFSSQ